MRVSPTTSDSRLERAGEVAARVSSLRPADPNMARALHAGIAIVILLSVGLALFAAAGDLPRIDWRLRPLALALGVAGTALFLMVNVELWRRLLGALGPELAAREAPPIWFASALGRYVPSSVLLPMLRVAMSERLGVPKRICLASVVYEIALVFTAALIVSAYFVIDLPSLEGTSARFLVLALPALALLALHPRLFHRAVDWAFARFGRAGLPVSLSAARVVEFVGLYGIVFMIAGFTLYALAQSVYPVGLSELVTVVGAFAVGTTVSLMSFVLPGGLIAREAGIALALSPVMPTGPAVAVAVIARIVQIAIEALLAVLTPMFARPRPASDYGYSAATMPESTEAARQRPSASEVAEPLGACRLCGNTELEPILDLGEQYLASVFPETLDYRESSPRYPLDLVMCVKGERTCGLPQLGHRMDLTSMYEAYPYTSAIGTTMPGLLRDVAESGRVAAQPGPGDTVLDIGGNDGTLLSHFAGGGHSLINIDPARNIESVVESSEYQHVPEFFSAEAFGSASEAPAKLVFTVAMFYHHNDPLSFAREVAQCLAEDGTWVIQMAYLPAMLRSNMYDNIVHEHAAYYATEHMRWALERAGLEIVDVTLNDVYGGSFRVFARHQGKAGERSDHVDRMLEDEAAMDLFDPGTYRAFAQRIERTREDLRRLVTDAVAGGRRVWVYGASTKGGTILQYCDLGSEEIIGAADANPAKVGRFMIGADIPIESEETMRAARPDLLLALPYSFIDAFAEREAPLLAEGTRFVVPLPDVSLVP